MKAPIVDELLDENKSENRPTASNKEPKEETDAAEERTEAKSYTLYPRHLAYINSQLVKLTIERGSAVNSSEALRVILDRVMEHPK